MIDLLEPGCVVEDCAPVRPVVDGHLDAAGVGLGLEAALVAKVAQVGGEEGEVIALWNDKQLILNFPSLLSIRQYSINFGTLSELFFLLGLTLAGE